MVESLGLRRIRHSVTLPDTPAVRGMILKVRHLVDGFRRELRTMDLSNLKPAEGSKRQDVPRRARPGLGNGKTAGRGHKGAQSRSG